MNPTEDCQAEGLKVLSRVHMTLTFTWQDPGLGLERSAQAPTSLNPILGFAMQASV